MCSKMCAYWVRWRCEMLIAAVIHVVCMCLVQTATRTTCRQRCPTSTVDVLSISTWNRPTSSSLTQTGVNWRTSAALSVCRQHPSTTTIRRLPRQRRDRRRSNGLEVRHVQLYRRPSTARLRTGRLSYCVADWCRRRLMSTRLEWRCGNCAVERRRTTVATGMPSSSPSSPTTIDPTHRRHCAAVDRPTIGCRPPSTTLLGPQTGAIGTSSAAVGTLTPTLVRLPRNSSDCSGRGGLNWTPFLPHLRSTQTTWTRCNAVEDDILFPSTLHSPWLRLFLFLKSHGQIQRGINKVESPRVNAVHFNTTEALRRFIHSLPWNLFCNSVLNWVIKYLFIQISDVIYLSISLVKISKIIILTKNGLKFGNKLMFAHGCSQLPELGANSFIPVIWNSRCFPVSRQASTAQPPIKTFEADSWILLSELNTVVSLWFAEAVNHFSRRRSTVACWTWITQLFLLGASLVTVVSTRLSCIEMTVAI